MLGFFFQLLLVYLNFYIFKSSWTFVNCFCAVQFPAHGNIMMWSGRSGLCGMMVFVVASMLHLTYLAPICVRCNYFVSLFRKSACLQVALFILFIFHLLICWFFTLFHVWCGFNSHFLLQCVFCVKSALDFCTWCRLKYKFLKVIFKYICNALINNTMW